MEELFDIEKFNLISDDENYYFFRSLEPGDIEDIENGVIKDGDDYTKLRTDRERWEETHQEEPRWNSDSKVTLEEMYSHIKIHYSLQTNCISLSSNANVARTYGEAFSDRYVMIKVPKKEMGERVFHAGQYMLAEIERQVEQAISSAEIPENIREKLRKIDEAKTSDEIKEIVKTRYKSEKLDVSKAGLRKGITYKSPYTRVSSYQSLNENQTLEKNKIIAKLTLLEHEKIMKPLMPQASNNNSLIKTLGSAFSSSEQIYYGDIEGNRITDISKEVLDMFGLLQQVEGQDKQIVDELKRELIKCVGEGKQIEIPDESVLKRNDKLQENITIEDMYELTEGKVEYGQANSIVRNMFYLAKGQSNARALAQILREITNNNPKYERVIEYIENNGFEIEPKISTRQSNKGYRLSESVNLNLKPSEIELVQQIKGLADEEQIDIVENGGLSNIRDIMNNAFSRVQRSEKISKEEYYAEAVFSSYNWQKIGIEEFTIEEKNNLLKRIQEEYCVELYKMLEEKGIDKNDIPTILLNIITRKNDFEITEQDRKEDIKEKRLKQYDKMIEENISNLKQELSIERIERFLGYYDVKGTEIQLRPYQQRAVERTEEIFKEKRFASVILPTGAGKSFVALSQLMEHKDEEMLYLAPQNEILEQMKDYIIKYIHGPINTLGKSREEIVAEVFPKLKLYTYSGLLARNGEEIVNKKYGFVVLDELHRTGAEKWGDRLNALIDNQTEETKVLGITATPRRDVDGINMANEMAEKLGYTNRDAIAGKHMAMNMSLTNAIRMGLVVNPKLAYCEYSLKTEGLVDKLKDRIEQIEIVKEKNEELEKYEKFRRSLEEAEGIQEILQSNVKKGGKYIVFLPVASEIEDEDGNVIGRKKGKDKLEEYEKQIAEYFKGLDIRPRFHSMLGEYGDKDNERRLEEFQNANSDDTEFMLVMNKANEGLHLSKLNGMIWLRPLDENSRILYLQQLGRIIYSEDPDNPTKDEDRPVVIDLVNNTLKVNWDNEITEQDDIELLMIIVDWVEKHDNELPDINSTDKEEMGYAKVLKEIQNKYKEYLDNDFEDLNEEQTSEVQEILRLGSLIDLWQMELPDRIIRDGESHERSFTDKNAGPFKLTGLLKDFVNLNDEVNAIYERTAVSKLIKLLEKLKEIGVDVSKLPRRGQRDKTLLKNIKAQDEEGNELDISEIVKEMPDDYNIGNQIANVLQAAKGNRSCKIEDEEIEKLIGLGLITREEIEKAKAGIKEESATTQLINLLEKLKEAGVDVRKLPRRGQRDKTLLKNIKAQDEEGNELDISEIVKEMPDDYNIGNQIANVLQAAKGNRSCKIEDEEIEKLIGLGLITREEIEKAKAGIKEESATTQLINLLEKLKEAGVDVSKLPRSSISKNALLKNIKAQDKEGNEVDISEIVNEMPDGYNIGSKIEYTLKIVREKSKGTIEKGEIDKLIGFGLITKEEIEKARAGIEESAVSQLIKLLEKLKEAGVDVSKLPKSRKLLKEIKAQDKEGKEVDISEIVKEMPDDYNIGSKISCALQAAKGNGNYKIEEEETEKLIGFGLITRGEIEKAKAGIKESAATKLINLLEKLKESGVDVSKLPRSGNKDKTLLKNIKVYDEEGKEVDISEIVKEMPDDYNIGAKIGYALRTVVETGKGAIKKEEIDKLIGYGLITREEIEKAKAGIKEESVVSKLINLLEKLKEAGVDVSKLPRSVPKDKTKTLLKNIKAQDEKGNEVDISEIVKEMPDDYNIGSKISCALQAAKGNGNYKIEEEETEKLIGFGLITRGEIEKAKAGIKESAATKLINLLEKLKESGVDVSKLPRSGNKDKTLLKNIKVYDEEGNEVDISEIVKEMPDDYNIGDQIKIALRTAKRQQGKITEETEKLIGFGLITREEIEKAKAGKKESEEDLEIVDVKRKNLIEIYEEAKATQKKVTKARQLERWYEQELEKKLEKEQKNNQL